MKNKNQVKHIFKNAGIIALSIVVAILIVKTNIVQDIFAVTKGMEVLTCFIAGIFFISAFTAAPASVILFKLAQNNSPLLVAFFGGLGGVIGDFIVFRFIKNSLAEDLIFLLKKSEINVLKKY